MAAALGSTALTEVALLVALAFGACMPSGVEVGRDSRLDELPERSGASGAPTEVGGRASCGSDSPAGEFSASGADATGGSVLGRGGAGGRGVVVGGSASTQGGQSGTGGNVTGIGGVGGGPMVAAGRDSLGGGTGGTTGGDGFVCPPVGVNEDAVWPLDEFCRAFGCPDNAYDATMRLLGGLADCSGIRTEMRKGCDSVQVSVSAGVTGQVYVFAGEPQVLVGAAINSAAPWGPCNVSRYFGGSVPRPCDAAETCSFCGPAATCGP